MAVNLFKVATSNAFTTTLDGSVTDDATALTLTSITGLQAPGVLVVDRIDANDELTPATREYISYTTVGGGQVTGCTRGLGGSVAQAHASGAVVEECWTIDHWNDFVEYISVEHSATGKHTKPTVTDYTPGAGGTATLTLASGNDHRITMPAGNITIALSGGTVGQKFMIAITQDSGGSRTVSWFSTIRWTDGTAPTLTTTANKRDVFGFIITGSNTYDGFIVGQNI
jgi:hypothetical protein